MRRVPRRKSSNQRKLAELFFIKSIVDQFVGVLPERARVQVGLGEERCQKKSGRWSGSDHMTAALRCKVTEITGGCPEMQLTATLKVRQPW